MEDIHVALIIKDILFILIYDIAKRRYLNTIVWQR